MDMTRRAALAATLTAGLVGGCSGLGTLNGINGLTPGDGGAGKVADGIAFGPDKRQRLDIYAPKGASALPVIVFFYGGSWKSGARGDYAFVGQALAAQGFVVVVADYRLVPQVRFPAFVEDGAAAVGWTADHIAAHGGDPARIAVAGHSAGGYIAIMLALDQRWLAARPGVIKAAVGVAGPYDFAPFAPGGAAEAAFGQAADIAATQPITYARGDAPPLLLLTGDSDTTVRPRNAEVLAAAVTARGGRVQTATYPGVGHIGIILALSKPFRGKAPVVADMIEFLTTAPGIAPGAGGRSGG